jgi:hypothetical protein
MDDQADGLWDDIEEYMSDLPDVPPAETVKPGVTSANLSSPAQLQDHRDWPESEAAATYEDRVTEEIIVQIREDVDQIKDKYILGKKVGRDITLPDGSRLAKPGDTITQRLIREVETAGLLVELIEHMTFDSFED